MNSTQLPIASTVRQVQRAGNANSFSFQRGLWTACAVLVVTMAGFQIYDVLRRLEIVIESTEKRFASVTQALAEQTASTLQSIDSTLAGIEINAVALQVPGDLTEIRQRLTRQLEATPHIRNLIVIDGNNRRLMVVGTDPQAAGAAFDKSRPETQIPATSNGTASDNLYTIPWAGASDAMLVLEHRRSGRDRIGIVALIDPDYFRAVYRSLDLGAGSEVTMFHVGGGTVATYEDDRVATEPSSDSLNQFRKLIGAPASAEDPIPGASSGQNAIFAARKVPGWPLAIGARANKADVLAPWYTQSTHSAIRTTSLCLSVIALMWIAVRQLTRRERAEERLGVQTALLDELFESAPEAIVMLDLDLRVTRVNREFIRMFGYVTDEVTGRLLETLIVPESLAEESRRIVATLGAGQHLGLESQRRHKDGSQVPVSILGAPILVGDRQIATYLIYRDKTERRLAESEQSKLESRLRQAEKLEAIGAMAGGIAHDFNNILAAILGYGDMARSAVPAGSALERHVVQVLAAANRAKALVDQILSFSQSTRGKRKIVRLSPIVKEAVDLIRVSMPSTINLQTRLSDDNASIIADSTRIHQLTMNLCRNAVHAMHMEGTLTVAVDSVESSKDRVLSHGLLPAGRYVCLTVTDSGSGMDPSVAAHAFDPFFTTRESGTGTGLGLAIVRGIVTDLGGAIQVDTSLGAGSSFQIFLPRSDASVTEYVEKVPHLPRGNGERILLVEDERPLMLLTEEMLAVLRYEPAGFTVPSVALAEFRADPGRFDAVVLDQVMPGMNGIEMARAIRGARNDIPMLLISGYLGPRLLDEARHAGIKQILSKPLNLEEFADAMAATLSGAAVG